MGNVGNLTLHPAKSIYEIYSLCINRRVRYGTKVVKRDTEALLGWPNHPGLDGPLLETPEPPFAELRRLEESRAAEAAALFQSK